MYEDKTLICKECGNEFVFTAGEQAFYAEKNFVNEPKSCKACRDARKNNTQLYTTVCANCGGEARVRFQPTPGRRVLCSACFTKEKAAQG